ncbi:MAG: AAA family ATPase [Clostridia bacterium]|nr:AAA family ATPase [Clostridia bacterium]
MGSAIVVTSGKGGVGKSTVSLGLAAQFAVNGERVLLVDCDAGLRSLDRMTGTEEALVFDSSDVVSGRCSPAEAIYPCEGIPGVFLMPAPANGEELVPASAMQRLVPLLKRYFDRVILDSPAGVGRGFRAAAAAADRALIICNSDPVCIRDAAIVRRLLEELEISEQRLIINRFNAEYFQSMIPEKTKKKFGKKSVQEDKPAGVMRDLDDVIDLSGVQLIGIVPEDRTLSAAFSVGRMPENGTPARMAFSRIAARLNGTSVPLVL